MKKYVKPELYFERYELSQQIANCTWEWVNNVDASSCKAKPDANTGYDGMVAFTETAACVDIMDGVGSLPPAFCVTNGGEADKVIFLS